MLYVTQAMGSTGVHGGLIPPWFKLRLLAYDIIERELACYNQGEASLIHASP